MKGKELTAILTHVANQGGFVGLEQDSPGVQFFGTVFEWPATSMNCKIKIRMTEGGFVCLHRHPQNFGDGSIASCQIGLGLKDSAVSSGNV